MAELTGVVDKPLLRGWLHAGMAPAVLGAGIALIACAHAAGARASAVVYTACGLLLFATSGVYHRGRWDVRVHSWLSRADHGNVYLFIAGTYTPVVWLALTGGTRAWLLALVWSGAALGVAFRWLWPAAPRWLCTALYVALGWCIAPVLGTLWHTTGATVFVLTLTGGVLYTLGAVVYATKRPDPAPRWFGFHEVFHACTVAAWVCQYISISVLAYR